MDQTTLEEIARQVLQHRFPGVKAEDNVCGKMQTSNGAIFEELHSYLRKLIGDSGFDALLSRALTEAKKDHPVLGTLSVQDKGTIKGLSDLPIQKAAQAEEILLVEIIKLLCVFIGDRLTISLLGDLWPGIPPAKVKNFKEGKV